MENEGRGDQMEEIHFVCQKKAAENRKKIRRGTGALGTSLGLWPDFWRPVLTEGRRSGHYTKCSSSFAQKRCESGFQKIKLKSLKFKHKSKIRSNNAAI